MILFVLLFVTYSAELDWQLIDAVFQPPKPGVGDFFFGEAVSLSNEYMAVTAMHAKTVYVYSQHRHGDWFLVGQLAAPSADANLPMESGFGSALAIVGDKIFVSAPWHERVYIFAMSTPNEGHVGHLASVMPSTVENKETAAPIVNGAFGLLQTIRFDHANIADSALVGGMHLFGASLDAADGIVVIGAPMHDENRGVAFVFEVSDDGVYVVKQILTASDARVGAWFGSTVVVSKRTEHIVVAAPYASLETGGSAYVFKKRSNEYVLEQRIGAMYGVASRLNMFAVSLDIMCVDKTSWILAIGCPQCGMCDDARSLKCMSSGLVILYSYAIRENGTSSHWAWMQTICSESYREFGAAVRIVQRNALMISAKLPRRLLPNEQTHDVLPTAVVLYRRADMEDEFKDALSLNGFGYVFDVRSGAHGLLVIGNRTDAACSSGVSTGAAFDRARVPRNCSSRGAVRGVLLSTLLVDSAPRTGSATMPHATTTTMKAVVSSSANEYHSVASTFITSQKVQVLVILMILLLLVVAHRRRRRLMVENDDFDLLYPPQKS